MFLFHLFWGIHNITGPGIINYAFKSSFIFPHEKERIIKKFMTTVEPIRSIENLKKLEDYLEQKNPRDSLLLTIGINCGLRISDIVALNVGDVQNKTHIQIIEKKT